MKNEEIERGLALASDKALDAVEKAERTGDRKSVV